MMNPPLIRHRVGLVLAGLLSATGVPSVLTPPPPGEVGPPMTILVANTVLGVIGLVAVLVAWRTSSGIAVRVAAGTLILSMLTGLPAFFVDIPTWLKLLVAISTLLTVLAVVLMLSPTRQPVRVRD